MAKAVAIAALYYNPFAHALDSARNFGKLVVDALYGTPNRTRVTYLLAMTLYCVGLALDINQTVASFAVCAL